MIRFAPESHSQLSEWIGSLEPAGARYGLQNIERVRGFMDWLVDGGARPRGEPVEVVDVNGIGCTFSRSLTEGEREDILVNLHAYVDQYKKHELVGMFSAPLAEISGARIDEVRAAVRGIAQSDRLTQGMESRVVLAFGARREAAEQKCKTLGPSIWRTQIVEKDGQHILSGDLHIPLNQDLGTVAEIQKCIEAARKEVGDVELDCPPDFIAEVSITFYKRATAVAAAERFSAAGLTTEIVEHVNGAVTHEVVHWQERWMAKSGRVEELMRSGVLSDARFLGDEERLDEVLKQDASTLASLGLTAADIADRLREIVGEALRQALLQALEDRQNGRSGPVAISSGGLGLRRAREDGSDGDSYTIGTFRVRIEEREFQECPWMCRGDGLHAIDFVLENLRSGATLAGSGFIVHLIAEHGFFQGLKSPGRVDPRQAAEVLDLPGG